MIPRVWAPVATSAELDLSGARQPMTGDAGWWTAAVDLPDGTDYAFRLDGGEPLPDPRAPRQPYGVKGASRTYDHATFAWTDAAWRGISLAGSVIYELHTGTFTREGTFDAIIGKLGHLRDLGATAIELMPVAAFPGEHGWGYDGIHLWAPHEPYGGPDGLKRLVDACHGGGIAVILDVVYNHIGLGNRLGDFGPYFTDKHTTPWGPALNLDQPGSDEVRRFLIENALMWLRDYHLDGLRLDAVHALRDDRALHFLEELSVSVRALGAAVNRDLLLIAESDANDPRLVTSREAGGFGLDAQWSDDFHHAVHCAVTGERQGYYADFASFGAHGALGALAKVYREVFFHNGVWSSFRGRSHGRPVDVHRVPSSRFLGYLQDHDQVGNRAVGDRITFSVSADMARVATGLVLTSPFTPMLFMGEEWGASTPFQYFTDHVEEWLAKAVSEGRRNEFARFGWAAADVPDPQDPATFQRCKLNWSELSGEPHASLLAWYRSLLELRRSVPALTDPRLDRVSVAHDEQARWITIARGAVLVAANLGSDLVCLPGIPADAALLLASRPGLALPALPPETFACLHLP
ncbi:MAG TPA: malto-oligosyltrehalose trehalohydrolase [Streptosporangiaceae bacterium]|nr:malto-oligosyltrehalose trehalohydrolase [Streptosporangiaceae bacterium]